METGTRMQQDLFGDKEPDTPHALIASDRVEGTAVRRPSGDKIGNIERLMINKVTGQVAYAVISFGGFLGLGQKHFPIPWERLKYSVKNESYEVAMTDVELHQAPSFESSLDFDWGDRSEEMRVRDFYKMRTYWDS